MRPLVPLTLRTMAVIGAAAAITATAPAGASTVARQSPGAQSATATAGPLNDALSAVAASSSSSAWAVGDYHNAAGHAQTLIEHWNGKTWKHVASPNPGGPAASNYLSWVAAVSPSSAWAVGGYRKGAIWQTLVEHWNGKTWKHVASPNPVGSSGSNLYGVAAVSSSSAWAVGYYTKGTAALPLIEHWNGKTWKQVASPNPGTVTILNTVTAPSSGSAWAVGTYSNGPIAQTLIEHWNGKTWKHVASPNPAGAAASNFLGGVAAVSSSSAWAVGSYSASPAERTLIERWNGKTWKQVASPNAGGATNSYLNDVAAVSSNNAWAAGETYNGIVDRTLIEHWNGKTWKHVASPNVGSLGSGFLSGVAAVSSSSAWAVGDSATSTTSLTLIEHWNGSSWKRVPSPNL